MYIFEIPTADVTFVKENKESELTPYSIQLLEIHNQIKKESEKNQFFKKLMVMLRSLMNPYNASVYNMQNTKQYWNLLEHIYTKMNKKSGCYIDSTSLSWCGYPGLSPVPLYYTNPDPTHKFDYITYRITKDTSSADKINIHDTNDLDGNLYHLQHMNKYLNVGGAALFIVIGNFNTTYGHLAFPYLLKSFFKKVVVCVTGYCIGIDYNGEIFKETTTYPSILSESIRPYIQFVKNVRQDTITCYNLLLKEDKMPFFKQFYTNTMALRKELNILQSKYHSNLFIFIFFHFGINPASYEASYKLIDDKLKFNMYPFPKDGYMLYNLIIDKKLKNVLELGCATGITSAYLLLGVKEIEGRVTSIDPTETTKWDSIGLHLIELMKLKTYHTFIEDPFYILAPTILLKKGENCIYDLVYINSYYTFDMTLTDIYFADKFVRVGGYLIIDNYTNNTITSMMMQILSYFKHYERVPLKYASHSIVFKKNRAK
jgi:predicted O-methyltransferase YrrM